MPRETDAADSLNDVGEPEADQHLVENFGMTMKQVREFDPQTLDVTRACKILGLPLKRFDLLASQPDARARWVDSVARQSKDLIATSPQASKEIREMLEAIRKFALRKCLNPDSPAQLDGRTTANRKKRTAVNGFNLKFIIAGCAIAVLAVVGVVLVAQLSKGGGIQPQPDLAAKATAEKPVAKENPPDQVTATTPIGKKDTAVKLPAEKLTGLESYERPKPAADTPKGHRERLAATYVFSVDGKIRIRGNPAELSQLSQEIFQITTVNLRGCKRVTDDGLKVFRGCPTVQHLDLVNTPTTGNALVHFKECKDLRVLDLVGSKADDEGLAQLVNCTKLANIWLGATKVTDKGLVHFQKLTDLVTLDVSNTAVTDKGIVGFAGMKSLRYLSVAETSFTDQGLAELKDCENLETLYLFTTRLTDKCIPTLSGFAKLKRLSVHGTKITAAGVKKLTAALPNCKID